MPKDETLTVALPPDLAALLHEAVGNGDYDSVDAAVQEAVEGWRDLRLGLDWPDDELRRMCEEALASGPAQDGPEAMAEIEAWLEAHLAGDPDAERPKRRA